MEKKQSSVTNRVGRALEGASVAVYNDSAVLATIYADNETTTLTNPLTTDALGAFAYKAADGVYSWVISHASITTKTLTEIQHEDPLDSPSPTVAALAAAGGAATVGVTPTATLAASNVQTALAELDAEKASSSALAAETGAALVGVAPTATLVALNVQTALAELDTKKAALTALSASTGSSLSGHIASGTGAVATTVQAKLRERTVVADFDSFQSAIDRSTVSDVALRLPAGKTTLTGATTYTATGDKALALLGDGIGVTILALDTGGDGLVINLPGNYWLNSAGGSNALTIRNMSITTTNANIGVGLDIIGASVEGRPGPAVTFENVEFRGYSSFGHFWDTAIRITDCSTVRFINCRWVIGGPSNITGKGVLVRGTAQANSPVNVTFIHPEFIYGGVQCEIGSYVEGVYITQPHAIKGLTGFKFHPIAGESGFHLFGGHIDATECGIDLDNVFDLLIDGPLIYRNGDTFNGWAGVKLNDTGRFSVDCMCYGKNLNDNEAGVYVQSSINNEAMGGYVAGKFHNFGARAIWLGADANYVHVGENLYRNCAVRVLNQSTSGNCHVEPAKYTITKSVTLAGGAATEIYDVPIPTGTFRAKPGACFGISDGTTDLIAFYDYASASSTATNARFVIRKRDGGVLDANTYRFAVACFENQTASM